jgi:hypothetical protein
MSGTFAISERLICALGRLSSRTQWSISALENFDVSVKKRSTPMMRTASALLTLVIFAGVALSADKADKAANNKMVKGTVKSVDTDTGVLIVNQELKKDGKTQVVDRELSIKPSTHFVIMSGDGKQEADGKDALTLLKRLTGLEGARVAVKCDKDVTPTTVTITLKK